MVLSFLAKHSRSSPDGVIYIATGADDVFAIAVETGKMLWEHRANLELAIDSVCCGWTGRGVGLGDGKIFVGQLDGRLVALDHGAPGLRAARTAALVMQTVSEGRRELPSFSSLLTAEQIRDVAGYVSRRLAQR